MPQSGRKWEGRGIPGSSANNGEPVHKPRPRVPDNILRKPLTKVPPMKRVKDA